MSSEAISRFDCFGGSCAVLVTSAGAGRAPQAVAAARRRLLEWHDQFSRFQETSEISRLNHDPRATVPVSPVMVRLVQAALHAARSSGGLVDPTLLDELEAAGYARSLLASDGPAPLALTDTLSGSPARAPAQPRRQPDWDLVAVDARARTVTRPPGVRLDGGGIAKGLFGDILASALGTHDSFAVDAAGDVRLGGRSGEPRPVHVADPWDDDEVVHTFALRRGAAATSAISRRAWRDDGTRPARPAHHLLDPFTGRPAFTGLIQVTALAPTGVLAETRAKAALLSGPDGAARWLPDGGVIIAEAGPITVIDAAPALTDPLGPEPIRPLVLSA